MRTKKIAAGVWDDLTPLRGYMHPGVKVVKRESGVVHLSIEKDETLSSRVKKKHLQYAWDQVEAFLRVALKSTSIDYLGEPNSVFLFDKTTGDLRFVPHKVTMGPERTFASYTETFQRLSQKAGNLIILEKSKSATELLKEKRFDDFIGQEQEEEEEFLGDFDDLPLFGESPRPIGRVADESELNSIPDELVLRKDLDGTIGMLKAAIAELKELQKRRIFSEKLALDQERLLDEYQKDMLAEDVFEKLAENHQELKRTREETSETVYEEKCKRIKLGF